MKKILVVFFLNLLLASTNLCHSQPNNEWNGKPAIFQINRLKAHSMLIPYNDLNKALQGDLKSSEN